MSDVMIILLNEELCQSSGMCVVTQGMNIPITGETRLYSVGTQFVWCLSGM